MSCGSPLPEAEVTDSAARSLDSSEWCEEHEQSLSVFCLDDLEPLCKQCAAGSHEGHRVYLLTEAATDCKEELRTSVNGLKKMMIHLEEATQTCKDASNHNQVQAKVTEEQVKKEFEQLHQFLQQEEETRLLALKKEMEEKTREAEERTDTLSQAIKSLEDKIQLIEEELDAGGDGVKFLEQYQDTAEREPREISGLINVAKHLGNIQFSVWDKMKHITPYTPVTLDPRTAGRSLMVSAGLTRVQTAGPSCLGHVESPSVPANPERFHPYSCILATEGFNSGIHCWDIQVGDASNWTVGVAAQSVSRGEEFEACPEAGLWCISLRDGQYQALTTPSQTLNLDESYWLKRVSVKLDWDEGKLEFTNPDTGMLLFTFNHRFVENMYPYFESISENGALAVLEKRVDVSVESYHIPDDDAKATQESEFPTTTNNKKMSDHLHAKEDKNLLVCSKKEETKTKVERPTTKQKLETKSTRRGKTSGNKPAVKKQPTSKPRFSVNYHVSLNRALNIINKESGKHQEI